MNVISFDYDKTYFPSAPVVEIEVDGYNDQLGRQTLWAMVDSGADATMIPIPILNAIGASYKESMWMRGTTGVRIEVDLHLVAIRIGPHLIRGLHVIGIPAMDEAVIGRDVLNELVLTLNGPAQATEIQVE